MVHSSLSKSDLWQSTPSQMWPRSKCWMRACGANIQHAATKDTSGKEWTVRGRLIKCMNNIIDKMQWQIQKHSILGLKSTINLLKLPVDRLRKTWYCISVQNNRQLKQRCLQEFVSVFAFFVSWKRCHFPYDKNRFVKRKWEFWIIRRILSWD